MSDRIAEISRETGETNISVRLNLDGQGRAEIDTPIGFMNHMLHALAKHSMMDLAVNCIPATSRRVRTIPSKTRRL